MHLIFKKSFVLFWLFQSVSLALGTNFLIFPENAVDLALGQHPSWNGSESVNPSLIKQKSSTPMFYINSGNWFGDISISGLNYVQKIGNYNNRLFLKQGEVNDLEFRFNKPSDDPVSQFSAYAFQLGSGIARKSAFGDIGIKVSYLSFGIYDQVASGLTFDVGFSKLLKNGIGIGVSILNLGYMSKLFEEKPKLPAMVLAGVSKELSFLSAKSRVFCTIKYSALNSIYKIKTGADFMLGPLRMLGGYSITKHTSEFSLGSGFNYGRFGFIYAMKFGSQNIGEPNIISISYRMP